jgi:hypothetical protein
MGIHDKFCKTKGVQIVFWLDVLRIQPRANMHRHKCHVAPPGWTIGGQVYVQTINEKLGKMVFTAAPVTDQYVFDVFLKNPLYMEQLLLW